MLQMKKKTYKSLIIDKLPMYIIEEVRPSQIACKVITVYVTCTQTALCVHENSCTVLIPLRKNNLYLPISHTDHYALITTTTTAFLISNTVVRNPYTHSTAFDPQSFAPFT